eukprot:COSAG02_NODE_9552_length_2181_cov_14.958772_1_plen_75_part_00
MLTDLLPRMIIAKELLLDVDDTTLFIIQSDHGGVMKPYLIQLLALLRYLDMQLSFVSISFSVVYEGSGTEETEC